MPSKGWIKNNLTGEIRNFPFNPEDFTYARSVTYGEVSAPGMLYPSTQFIKGESRSFQVKLFLYDKPTTGLIDSFTLFIGAFLTPETNVYWYVKPPSMTFCMGTFIRQCVLENLEINIAEYDSNLKPVQAYFSLTLRQVGV